MVTGPADGTPDRTAGHGHLRASRADREQATEVLKTAFVQERLTKDELDTRIGQALAARTYAELNALTSDLDVRAAAGPAAAGPSSTPFLTLAKAARRSGVCLLAAFAAIGIVALTQPGGLAIFLAFASAVASVIAASGFLGYGVVDAWQEHRARRPLPPRPGGDSRGLPGGRAGRDPDRPGDRPDPTRVDMSARQPRPGRRHPSGLGSRAPGGARVVLGGS